MGSRDNFYSEFKKKFEKKRAIEAKLKEERRRGSTSKARRERKGGPQLDRNSLDAGYVYIFSNVGMPGLVKVGHTTIEDFQERANQLSTTGVPYPFTVEAVLRSDSCKELERRFHKKHVAERVSLKREFFNMSVSDALKSLTALSQ